eukprot:GEMP01006377.1.p1 GENE.GEMP01006377.1~~GEMP01006377.1.p1  ORF type:complete len:729 (+),score=108.72 GEMP01006377.1:135-2321(+)
MGEVDDMLSVFFHCNALRSAGQVGRKWSSVLEAIILSLICLMSFLIRLFAVIRYESVIHEFDPHFNWRTTEYLNDKGFYDFWNWFDDGSWYPLGRVVGQTLYPGLMTSAVVINMGLNALGFIVSIKDTCVFFAPIFSGLCALAAHYCAKEATGRPEAGLFSAFFMSIVPSYLSRSVAGSYDNEGCAIFAILFTFYTFAKAVNTGSLFWGMGCALAYLYMVASWGGYIFVVNTIAIYTLLMIMLGRFSSRLFVAYSAFYVVGTVYCFCIPFVGFNAVVSSEHLASHGVFLVSNVYLLQSYLIPRLPKGFAKATLKSIAAFAAAAFIFLVVYLTVTGKSQFGGRSMTMLDPTYASKYIPIIASVSEHQPTTWPNYIMDMHMIVFLAPVGVFLCFKRLTDASIFIGVFGIIAVYFSGVMIRLLLVLSAAASLMAGIGASWLLSNFLPVLRKANVADIVHNYKKKGERTISGNSKLIAVLGAALIAMWSINYVTHCTWTSAFAYSSPSIVMMHKTRDGGRVIQDDFRESYYWLRQNTHQKATIACWWDYGYQISVLGNRTVHADNNTWNTTHIATIALLLGSPEKKAYEISRRLDADYILVIFGGVGQYQSDDIAKFIWPVRIANGVFPNEISEADFTQPYGYRVDQGASETFRESMVYKMSYYRVAEVTNGQDSVRGQKIGYPDISFQYFEEAFTSENWIVRIFKVKDLRNREAFRGAKKDTKKTPKKKKR